MAEFGNYGQAPSDRRSLALTTRSLRGMLIDLNRRLLPLLRDECEMHAPCHTRGFVRVDRDIRPSGGLWCSLHQDARHCGVYSANH